ncbi:AGZA family xanthine/uracil permease-like MFS transporter [Dysgonomonas sp. PFB1-18]|uniref:NCS2 family permease n=1 Tax=unclassified Dysgonomonas TaxID=2630389 RepID=UPI002473FB45|nr:MULTISPECIES: NCS2 family permease [unclassified Dysgonomonas]MDH6310716.1 AGZA family xanthine/uracil permease-like MFS transporter [Dysgonomonas sp. PF1-14]MDH6340567.1 AGZA family xanthine/uracil permease-like MFS transporter [Dysgonomonas sp. PF1-16]MDH6382177.1 AGZA family xanthine/uracil permease-like MFS transporter [Dysgonomonas sp. PFB1-18]MDH6399520.1 AGZA family xanthine/uracil permease-like MFS transporter [Dysgonomonas sp. PF1-23]
MKNLLERTFKLSENKTTIRKELLAGLITFLTMSYILIVNPSILSATGMDKDALFTTTALATIFATLLMAFLAKLPIAQAPGMGLNSFFAFSVVLGMGYSWQFALTAVFIEGIIFILLTFFNIRELIVKSIPKVLKDAIPVGIGLFITLIGLKGAGIVVANENTLLTIGDFSQHSVWIALLGLLITAVLFVRNVNGSILIGIVVATLFGIILGDVKLPEGAVVSMPPSIAPIFAKFEWNHIFTFDMLIVVFTFLFVNLFDTVGTLIGVVSKAGLADEDGNFPQMKKALFADALGTTVGAVLGTSTITSYVESASGVASGGRTGLTAVSTAMMFVLALFFAPLFLMVPAAATAPALVIVGLFMISSVAKINFNDMSEGLPAFLTIVFMPFTYSIAEGIVFGMLSFAFIKVCSGKSKDVSVTVYVIAVLFLLKIILDASHLLGH